MECGEAFPVIIIQREASIDRGGEMAVAMGGGSLQVVTPWYHAAISMTKNSNFNDLPVLLSLVVIAM